MLKKLTSPEGNLNLLKIANAGRPSGTSPDYRG
jgi:hypothetical protein